MDIQSGGKSLALLTIFLLINPLAIAQEAYYHHKTNIEPEIEGPTQEQLNQAATNVSDWLYALNDYSGKRYVPLNQIDTANVSDIRPICTLQAGDKDAFSH